MITSHVFVPVVVRKPVFATARIIMLGKTFLIILADVVGWGYFFCWTVSFLPQIYENWPRKCVVGFSFDMLGYFLLSYVTYVIYNVTAFFKPELVFEKSDEDNPVKLTDVVFAIVAFVCTSFQGIQCLMYDRGSQAIHLSTVLACGGCLVALAALVILKYFGVGSWFLVLQYCGYVKLVVSFGTVSLRKCFILLKWSTYRAEQLRHLTNELKAAHVFT